jgi:O-antigen/teichoic acid export membrane protein
MKMAETQVDVSNSHEDLGKKGQVKSSVRDLLLVAGPKVGAGGLQILTNLLLVRSLGPERSGVLFVCITGIILGDAVVGSALDVAVVRLATSVRDVGSDRSLEVQKTAMVAKLLGFVLLALPVGIWARRLSAVLFHQDSDPRLLMLSACALFGLLALRSIQTYFQIAGRFLLFGVADSLHSVARFGGTGALLALGVATPANVLMLYALGPPVVVLALLPTAARDLLAARFSNRALRELTNILRWYLGAAAAGSVNSRMDIMFVSALAGTAQAGIFSAAQVFVIPFQLIGMYLGVVLAPRIMPLWEKGLLGPLFFRFQAWAGAASIATFAIAFLAAGKLTAVLLPHRFASASGIVLLLLPSSLMALMNFPWTVTFLMFTHPRLLFLAEICAVPILVIAYRLSIASYGAAGAAAVTSGFALAKTALYHIVASWTLRRGSNGDFHGSSVVQPVEGVVL